MTGFNPEIRNDVVILESIKEIGVMTLRSIGKTGNFVQAGKIEPACWTLSTLLNRCASSSLA